MLVNDEYGAIRTVAALLEMVRYSPLGLNKTTQHLS